MALNGQKLFPNKPLAPTQLFFLVFAIFSPVFAANETIYLFESHTFKERTLSGHVNQQDLKEAWENYHFPWEPLELTWWSKDQKHEKKAHVTNCREYTQYVHEGWFANNTYFMHLADSFYMACTNLKILADATPLNENENREKLNVISNYKNIVFSTLPFSYPPNLDLLDGNFPENITLGALVEGGHVDIEWLSELSLRITFGDNSISLSEIATAKFDGKEQKRTLMNVLLRDRGTMKYPYVMLFQQDEDTGLIYCEDF